MRPGRGPDFVGIGAQKAGTTWLYENLRVQPGVWMPPVKEIHFFNTICAHEELLGVEAREVPSFRDPDRYRPLLREPSLASWRWLRRFYGGTPTTEWYYRLFSSARAGDRLAGDITPAYSTLDERGVRFARRILKPHCRVFFVIRDPVERAWSALKMLHRWQGTDITRAQAENIVRQSQEPSHRLRGDYARTIQLWSAAFGDHFAVFRYDELVRSPGAFLRDVLSFLGVKHEPELDSVGVRSNPDPARHGMPDPIRRQLESTYRRGIEELDALVPGVADDWISSRSAV